MGFSVIEFEAVGKKFRDGTDAVQDLNLRVPSDQITVVVGPSGCGKTTTLRMVNRMLEPTSGTITWDGTPLRSRRKTTLRRQMGYVIQSGGLFPHRTVVDNIGTVPGLLGWDKSKIRKRSYELLESVGLDKKMADRYPAQLSGGQQQRVGVARALAADPLVLLMDEPFSAVDPVVRSELHEFFLGLQRELSKTIMLITHDIEEAIKLGDQVAIMRVGGRLAQAGTPQQLLDEPDDAFVEGFIGRDRGYRSLSFLPAGTLTLDGVKVVREAGPDDGAEPTLIIDADARPIGWAEPQRPGEVYPVGSVFVPETDTLRAALDSALTSPYGLAVAVAPETGRYAGVVAAPAILAQASTARTDVVESISVHAAEVRKDLGAVPGSDHPEDGGTDGDDTGTDGTGGEENGVGEVKADQAAAEQELRPSGWERPESSAEERTGATAVVPEFESADSEPADSEPADSEGGVAVSAGPGTEAPGPDESDQSSFVADEPVTAEPGETPVPDSAVRDRVGMDASGADASEADGAGPGDRPAVDDGVADPQETRR